MREGFIFRLQGKWLATGCGDVQQPSTEKMGVNDIGGAFLVVSFGCIASGVFLLLEYVVWYVLLRREMLQQNKERKRKSFDHAVGALTKVMELIDAAGVSGNII